MKPADLKRIADRHSDIPQDGFPELDYLTPPPEPQEDTDESAD